MRVFKRNDSEKQNNFLVKISILIPFLFLVSVSLKESIVFLIAISYPQFFKLLLIVKTANIVDF